MKVFIYWRGKFRMWLFWGGLSVWFFSGCHMLQPEPPVPSRQPILSASSQPEATPMPQQQREQIPITLIIEPWIFEHQHAHLPSVYFQAEHLSADKLQFDPSDPSKLKTWHPNIPGNENTPQPQAIVGEFRVNQDTPLRVTQGRLALRFAEPVEENLEIILSKYKGYVSNSSEYGIYWVQADMTTIDLTKLIENIQIHNTRPGPKLREARFMNLESAKTFALTIELLLDERVSTVGFSQVFDPTTF